MIRKLLSAAALSAAALYTHAQQVRPANATQVYHEISQLQHLTHVLYLAAHPDDENTRFLAWMVNDQHIRTAYLSLTRGDGGQNILGSEQGSALGLIRTHELMEARKIDGAEQFFTRFVDFGFSKNYDETFKHWNQYILTHDVSYVMRKYRPDVVICRFPPNAQAGHGQHAASAIIAEKAFKVAGDKSQYTEDFKLVQPWQPKRLLFNAFRFGSANTTSEDMYKLPVGQYNAMLGLGYGELAGISRSIHKSQGAGTPSVAGIQTEYFKLVAGDSFTTSIFDGIDISWNRVGRKEIGEHISAVLKAYDFRHPENSLPALLQLRKEIATVNDPFWKADKLEELDRAILHASGFMAELVTQQQMATAGSTLPFTLNIITRSGNVTTRLQSVNWINADTTYDLTLKNDGLTSFSTRITIPANTPVSQPYWMSAPSLSEEYTLPEDSLLGLPETPNNLNIFVHLGIGDNSFTVAVPLSFKKLDPLKGDVVEPLLIVPEATVEVSDKLLITKDDGTVSTTIHLHAYAAVTGDVEYYFTNSKTTYAVKNIHLNTNSDTLIPVKAILGRNDKPEDCVMIASFTANGKKYEKTQKLIQYSHLPTLQYFTPAVASAIRKDWQCTVKKIGYIEGAGDYTATMLRLAGLQVDVLKDADLNDINQLKRYDAIITGVRAVNVEKKMSYWMPALLEYVQQGGTLVMQYNTLQDMATTNIGPYPMTLSTLRTTEENAPVTFLDSNNRLMTHPNRIRQQDFANWVQERGLYYPTKYDDHYKPLFRMNDTGEEPQNGATLYTAYGKGHYIYTSLSLFRQLPAANKGAIRLLMNMISVGK